MKKRWKIFWIVSGIVFGIGIVLTVSAIGLGALKPENAITGTWDFAEGWLDFDEEYDADEHADDAEIEGDAVKIEEAVRELDVEVSEIHVRIEAYGGDKIQIVQRNIPEKLKLKIHTDGDKLKIETKNQWELKGSNSAEAELAIMIPENYRFEEAGLRIGAGTLAVDTIEAQEIDVEVGAGTADIFYLKADKLNMACGAGELDVCADVSGKTDIECGVGRVSYAAAGNLKDYNYSIKSGIGSVRLGDDEYGGIANTKKVDNKSSKTIDIECGLGEVEVTFETDL